MTSQVKLLHFCLRNLAGQLNIFELAESALSFLISVLSCKAIYLQK